MAFKTTFAFLLAASALLANPVMAEDAPAKPPATAKVPSPEAAVAVPDNANLESAIQRLQKGYEGMTSLKVDVQQTSRLSTLAKEEVQTGKITMAKPGKIRWTFESPTERLFISDGKLLSIYNVAEKQVIQQPLSGQSGVGIDFLLGLGDVKKDFDVTLETDKEYKRANHDTLSLTPKGAAGNIARMVFSVDQETGLVIEAWTFDPMDNRTHLAFTNMEVNPETTDELFQFVVPEGVELIDAGGF